MCPSHSESLVPRMSDASDYTEGYHFLMKYLTNTFVRIKLS